MIFNEHLVVVKIFNSFVQSAYTGSDGGVVALLVLKSIKATLLNLTSDDLKQILLNHCYPYLYVCHIHMCMHTYLCMFVTYICTCMHTYLHTYVCFQFNSIQFNYLFQTNLNYKKSLI